MTGIGDVEPDDAYDEGDSTAEKLVVLARVLRAVVDEPDRARFLIRLAWVRRKLDELTGG